MIVSFLEDVYNKNLTRGIAMVEVKTRNGKEVKIDDSPEAFEALPQESLRDFRTKDLGGDKGGRIFLVIGVAPSMINGEFIGPPVIWVPAVLWKLFQLDFVAGIGLLIFGVFISSIDNFVRPYLQHRVGRTRHKFPDRRKVPTKEPDRTLDGIVAGRP